MGYSTGNFADIGKLIDQSHKQGNEPLRAIDLGSQDVTVMDATDFQTLVAFIEKFGGDAAPVQGKIGSSFPTSIPAREIFLAANFDYICCDVDMRPGTIYVDFCTHKFDPQHYGQFDLVLNAGTSEHLSTPVSVLFLMHHLCRKDGILFNEVPMAGWMNHGLNNMTPKFWHALQWMNSYEVLNAQAKCVDRSGETVDNFDGNFGGEHLNFITDLKDADKVSATIQIIFKKTSERGFILPYDLPLEANISAQDGGEANAKLVMGSLHPYVACGALSKEDAMKSTNDFLAYQGLPYRIQNYPAELGNVANTDFNAVPVSVMNSNESKNEAMSIRSLVGAVLRKFNVIGPSEKDAEIARYKHAFETTAEDRDRLASELAALTGDNSNAVSKSEPAEVIAPETPELEPQNTEPLVVDNIAPVSSFKVPAQLRQKKFDTLFDWVNALFEHPAGDELVQAFEGRPPASTISASERTMIYYAMREMKVKNSLEIGSYFAGTTELMALAAYQDKGRVYSIDPYGADRVPGLLRKWPADLANCVDFRAQFSTHFLGPMNVIPDFDLIFVDGDHRYPNVIHDLLAADENLVPNGIMIIDNAELPDVMTACDAFVRQNKGYEAVSVHESWIDGQGETYKREVSDSLKPHNSNYCFVILRKPAKTSLLDRLVVYWINDIKELKAPPVTITGLAEKAAVLDVVIHMRYFTRDEKNPDVGTVRHQETVKLKRGKFNHVIECDLALPDKAEGQILNAEVILSAMPNDGTLTEIDVKWGKHTVQPNRNILT